MAGDLRRLRGDRDKKSVPHCIVHACMNGLFFLTTELHQKYIKITSLLRQIAGVQQNYIKSTSLLRHFYIIFTSDLTSELFVHPPPLPGPPARAENGFSGCAGNASRPRNKLRIRSPLSGWFMVAFRAFIGF